MEKVGTFVVGGEYGPWIAGINPLWYATYSHIFIFSEKNLNLSLIAGDIRTKANSLSRKVPA